MLAAWKIMPHKLKFDKNTVQFLYMEQSTNIDVYKTGVQPLY
jgi:hypothetical protein